MNNLEIKKIILDNSDCDISKIILFGSRAKRTNRADSDYDVLIVSKNSLSLEKRRRIKKDLRTKFADLNVDADILLKSESEVNSLKMLHGSVINEAVNQGENLL
jgi:predicted nucleotidyltransferase